MKRLEDYGIERDPVIEVYKKDVDITLLQENLKLSVKERCDKAIRAHRFFRELRRGGEALRAKRTT